MNGLVAVAGDVTAILLMLGILLQTPKATGLGGTLGGGSAEGGGYRRRRGIESTLFRLSWVLTGLFVLISVISTISTYRS